MNISGTLNMDINPRDAKNGTWAYARNVLLSKGYMSMENEGGFDPDVINLNGKILGWIITSKGVVVFIKEDNSPLIRLYLYNTETHNAIIKATIEESIFPNSYVLTSDKDFSQPLISGVYTFNYKGELIIVWCNGIEDTSNPICIINVDDPPSIATINDILFNRQLVSASIKAKCNTALMGNLKSGTYTFGISVQSVDGTSSSSTVMSFPVQLVELVENKYSIGNHVKAIERNQIVNAGIDIDITFDMIVMNNHKLQLNVIHDDGLVKVAYIKKNIPLKHTQVISLTTLDDFVSVPLQEVINPINPFTHTNNLSTINIDNASQLLMGGVRFDGSDLTWTQGQYIANRVRLSSICNPYIEDNPFYNKNGVAPGQGGFPLNVSIPLFEIDEVYAFYLMLRSKQGTIMGIWHIPARPYNIISGDQHLTYHENTEVYPNSFPDYPNQKVRHFKIQNTLTEAGSNVVHKGLYKNKQVQFYINASITHIEGLPTNNIGEAVILHAKRNFNNNRVIGNDTLHPFEWFNQYVNGSAIPRANQLNWRGHCFDLKLTKASIEGINEIHTYSIYTNAQINVYNGAGVRSKEFYQNVLSLNEIIFNTPVVTPVSTNGILNIIYVPHDTMVEDNMKGESHLLIKTEGSFTNAIGIEAGIQSSIATSNYKFRVKYIRNVDNYYTDYENQELIVCGKAMYGSNTIIACYGDIFKSTYYMRLTKLIETTDENKDENAVRAVFRMFNQGIFNSAFRLEGSNTFEKIAPFTEWSNLTNEDLYPASRDNYLNSDTGLGYNIGYAKRNDYYQGVSQESDIFVKTNPNFIARSDIYSPEGSVFNWRTFRANNYYIMPFNMGLLILLISDGVNLYIQLENELFIANSKNILTNEGLNSVYLGSGDIFDRPPRPLFLSQDGHIGCSNKLHAALTPYGYLCVDQKRKRVILVQGDKPISISENGLSEYFKNKLPNIKDIRVSYDDEYDRVFVHFGCRNKQLSESVSYSVAKQAWTSFHDYYIDYAINSNRKSIYLVQNYNTHDGEPDKQKLTIFTPEDNFGLFGEMILDPNFKNQHKQSFVDIYFTKDILQPKLLQSLVWKSISNLNGINNYEDTISGVMIYNDTQCMPTKVITKPKSFYDSETAILVNGVWYFNNIDDCVINDKNIVINKNNIPFLNLIPNMSNINIDKDWFTKSKFITDYAITRLYIFGLGESPQRKLIVNFVDFLYQKDAR